MSRVVAIIGRQFGSLAGPSVPTLTVVDNGDGTATATISGSSSEATNLVWTQLDGSGTWVNSGSRIGNGTVTISLTNGRYIIYVGSTLNSQQTVSNLVFLTMDDGDFGHQDLEHSPAQIVAKLLVDLGETVAATAGATTAWQTFYGNEPTTPDNVATVYDTPGNLDGTTQTDGEVQEHYGIQIRVRAGTHAVGYKKINDIMVRLDQGVINQVVTVDAVQYLVFSLARETGIFALGKEMPQQGSAGMVSKRQVFTFNAVVSLRRLN